ncbi:MULTISPECIES: hypothetical protein [Haloferax]|jgi:hypothetical protein|uniref:DUF6788 domain-containing protein n=3 Tax=Haloferax volcanii TaxID=2246 RepID=D4H0E6_HALVD|nr:MULTISPECIES: hypothetical protein [Haloferax]ADE05263.1 uncharacterized protein HVO_C0062 [Haloferax volcanii DS2]ELY30077.1 hypothetical protein C498_10651 [Haloferax volcanii DS2]MBS8121273.1 hypothetical protein [Haloferax volcanii]MBS8126281.1 hypothetical protein [Haloferax volcanii]MBS8130151.1 hypothetical protein [Haloferax volcanii]
MTPNKPDAPERIARYILDGLDRQDAETLREIATHAENLAAWKEAKAETELEEGEDIVREDSAEDSSLPDDVPKKAGVVVKTINDNQYYYYQWREGDQVKSKYKGPVNPSE